MLLNLVRLSLASSDLNLGVYLRTFLMPESFFKARHWLLLGRCYAAAIIESGVEFDVLFGPAYKGITLVAATAVAWLSSMIWM